ncbi:MAG: NUDIX domain-containing protein [Pseudobdellovibrionaceae bacterium]
MIGFPCTEWDENGIKKQEKPQGHILENMRIRHVFTHFTLELTPVICQADSHFKGEGTFIPIANLNEAGFPTLFKKLFPVVKSESV